MTPAMIQQLIQALPQTKGDSQAILQSWLKIASTDAIPSLLEALKSPNPALRFSAIQALGTMGPDARSAIPAVLTAFNDSAEYRIPAAQPNPNEPLYTNREFSVPSNSRNSLRIEAMITIARILYEAQTSDDRPIAPATKLLQDRDPEVQLIAAWLLQRLTSGSQATTAIYINALTRPELRSAAKEISGAFSGWGTQTPPEWFTVENRRDLLKLLSDEDKNIQNIAIGILARIDKSIVPELITRLSAADIRTKHAAIDVLKEMGQPASSAVPSLTNLLKDTSSYSIPNWEPWMVSAPLPAPFPLDRYATSYAQVSFPTEQAILTRSKAIDAIGQIGVQNPETLAALNQLAKQDQNTLVRLKASWAAIVLGGDVNTYIPSVESILNSPDKERNYIARNILKAIGKPGGKALISHYLKQLDNPAERVNTVLWFGNNRLGAANLEAVPRIRPYLEDSDQTLRGYTVTILANIADSIISDARSNQLSDRQLRTAIEEYAKVNEITQKPNAKFNAQPVERLQNSLSWLKQHQASRSKR
jgi:hypothetical protein